MFGETVRSHRHRLGMTQEELAEKSGLSVRSISSIETGRMVTPRPPTVRLLAEAFGLVGSDRERFCLAASVSQEPPDLVPARPPADPVPAQLPADVSAFAGRDEYLTRLDGLLARAGEPTHTAVLISAVSGTAGVGKTTLAVHWAHRISERFPDGQLYVNLRGFDPGGQVMAPGAAIRGLLDALGVPPERIPSDPAAQAGLYRSRLAGKRILILLDNARDAEQVRPLLPGTPTAFVVVTSRDQLTPLVAADSAYPVALDLLTPDEARQFLVRRLGQERVAAEPVAVDSIITACARLPLALAVIVARAQQTGFPLAVLATELARTGQRLDALDAGDVMTQVRAVFSWSYRTLEPAAARLFRLLGVHAGPDISMTAAAGLAGQAPGPTRRELAELVRANLLVEHAPGRYTLHDLLRIYAEDLAHDIDPAKQRHAAVTRLIDYYLHSAYAADRLLHLTRDPVRIPLGQPVEGVDPERFTDRDVAMAWLIAEHPVVLATLRNTAGVGLETRRWQLAWAVDRFLYRQGHWHDEAAAWQSVLGASADIEDPAALAVAHHKIASASTRLGRCPDAHTHLRRALKLYTEAGDLVGQADTHHNLAMLRQRQERHRHALDHAKQALVLHQAAGHGRGRALALNSVGWHHALLGEYAEALDHCQQALAAFRLLGYDRGEAATWDSLGYVHHHLGDHASAASCYRRALLLLRDLDERYNTALVLDHLGDALDASADPGAARAAWRQALDILTDLAHPDTDNVRAKLGDHRRASGG